MAPLQILAAAAFILPGAVVVRLWDYFGWRQERSQLGMLGWALLVGAVEYGLITLAGGDLTRLFTDDGSLRIATLLSRDSMGVYLAVLAGGAVVGAMGSRAFHSTKAQGRLAAWFGRSFVESGWTEFGRTAVNQWVILALRSGTRARGWLSYASERPEGGYLVLSEAATWDPDTSTWLATPDVFTLAVALADVEYTLVQQPPSANEANDAQDRPSADPSE